MRFDRISLRNFKCYADADLEFSTGVSVIHGPNGSGKSSLLEACFFALYGSKALPTGTTLDDVITIGEDECEVTLAFTHSGSAYRVHREVKVRGDSAQTTKCVMETPNEEFEGARDVRRRVIELLRMDNEAFVNCAYVRQGEVNKLIHATPGERQDVLDDLLQLGKLEDYRERARRARLGVEDVLGNVRGNAAGVEEQVEHKESKGLHERINDLETELKNVEGDIERFENNREQAQQSKQNAASVLEEYAERRTELDELRSDINELEQQIAETERERNALKSKIQNGREQTDEKTTERERLLDETTLDQTADEEAVRERLEAVSDERNECAESLSDLRVKHQEHKNEFENAENAATDLEKRATKARERAEELVEAVDEAETQLAERRTKGAELETQIESATARFENAPITFGDASSHQESLEDDRADVNADHSELEVTVETLRASIEEAERLKSQGKCPECGQPVGDSPHVDSLAEKKDRLADLEAKRERLREQVESLDERIERASELVEAERAVSQLRERRTNVAELIEDREASIESDRERAEEHRERANKLENEAETKREAASETRETVTAVAEQIETQQARIEEFDGTIERLEEIQAIDREIGDLEDEIDRHRDGRESMAELNSERRDRLSEKRSRRDELAEAYDEDRVETARGEKQRAEDYLEKVEPKLAELREQKDGLQSQLGGVHNELEELESLRDRRDELTAEVDRLESLREEAETLEGMYGDLRAELRQQNVNSLERMLNEVFDLVYRNDSYSRIELDGDYELTVYQKDGEPLDPEQLSGGERALFNLSLRCAIYRLLAEGIEGAAPMPPLVLDEPTVFLDSGHVLQLVELVESMRQVGVEQIVVVSHDDELVGAADDLIRVSKNPTSNRSTVERADALDVVMAAD